ncbi:hypothetical protein [Nocardia wallacei]|uniref:hypothetical protein n=1 Tax=Nocardia wallacei TaxID=480035 RepID=UPI0024574EB8|nr:hypothetical protein [Nocardia wallacei]
MEPPLQYTDRARESLLRAQDGLMETKLLVTAARTAADDARTRLTHAKSATARAASRIAQHRLAAHIPLVPQCPAQRLPAARCTYQQRESIVLKIAEQS